MKPRNYFKNRGFILLLICLLAFCIRIWFFTLLQPWNEQVLQEKVLTGDAGGYQAQALDIITNKSLLSPAISHYKPLGYPLLLVFTYLLFGIKPWIVLFLQIFLDTAIVLIVYFIAKDIFNSEQTALIAAFLYAINFLSAYYSVKLYTEIPFTFVFTLAILIFIKSLKGGRALGFVLTGLLVGLGALLRSIAQYLPLALSIVILFSEDSFLRKLRNLLILVISFLIAISPWQFRNLRMYGHYALATAGGQVLLAWDVAAIKADLNKTTRYEAEAELIGNSLDGVTNPFERSKIKQKIALSCISQDPLLYIKYWLKGGVRMFLGTARSGISDMLGIKIEPQPPKEEPLSDTARRIIRNFYNELPTLFLLFKQIIEYIFLMIGLIIMCVKYRERSLLLFIMIIVYFAVFTGPVGYARYRIPIVPFYLVISAKGIFETFKFFGNTLPEKNR